MKDYKLNISVKTSLENSWIKKLWDNLKEVVSKATWFWEKLGVAAWHFSYISNLSTVLKDKLWWLFWNAIDEADKLNNSMVGLKSIVNWTWNDFKKAEKFIQDFTKDWLVTTWEAATSLKNLLSKGYWMDDAR